MRILVTGVSGYIGAELAPRLLDAGHDVRGFARDARRVHVDVPLVEGDAVTGAGLDEALDGVEVAYYLIHSMEPAGDGGADGFQDRDRRAAEGFAQAARRAGVRRVVYLGGPVPQDVPVSPHLASRLEVEEIVGAATPDSVALRASIVIGARSRSFRFLVRLVERMPVIALPPWREFRTRPVDGRDIVELLARAGEDRRAGGRSLDAAGRDEVSYGELVTRIRDALVIGRPTLGIGLTVTGIASRVAAVIAGEEHELVGPLMGSLTADLLPRPGHDAAELLGVRTHRLDAAIERALRDWEAVEPLAAR